MTKLKLIRYEVVNDINPKLNCGIFLFPFNLLVTERLTQDEIDRFNFIQSEITEPDIPKDLPCQFYFTEKGFMTYAPNVEIIRKGLLPVFEIKETYLELDSDDPRIVYQDNFQIAIKIIESKSTP